MSMLVSSLQLSPTPASASPKRRSSAEHFSRMIDCVAESKWQPSWLLPAHQYAELGSLKGANVLSINDQVWGWRLATQAVCSESRSEAC